jgi:hypothetical protein
MPKSHTINEYTYPQTYSNLEHNAAEIGCITRLYAG